MSIEESRYGGPPGDSPRLSGQLRNQPCGRMVGLLAVLLIVAIAVDAGQGLQAEVRKATIVGLGAATCQQFSDDVKSNPNVRRDYLAWVQGYMSGILVGRPPGIDEGLQLNPPIFGLVHQLRFLEEQCAQNTSQDFSDTVEALYRRLREEGKK